ncbi:MAG TPA: cation diffusion facilitator family transporter [Chloroflexia bacterium]|nr:cation diffusion facilitator family transporter [Chloroflexia bacterium]
MEAKQSAKLDRQQESQENIQTSSKNKVIYLSIGAALTTIVLKFTAFFLTGSVGLLSDALESMVNLLGSSAALVALMLAVRPADRKHHYGHTKVEYFSSGLEGGLILVAAAAIAWTAIGRLLQPEALESVGFGLAVSLVATLVNFVVARILLKVGREEDSIALEADGKHLMTDVVTSIGVVVGVILVAITGWLWLDPLVALAVALNIIFEGGKLVRRSMDGLIDRALPENEEGKIREIIEQELKKAGEADLTYHGLRTRKSGSARFIDLHLLTPGDWPVRQAHEIAENVEQSLQKQFRELETTIHIEPIEDQRSYDDNWETGLKSQASQK